MTVTDLLDALDIKVPEFRPLMDEHVEDNGVVHLHLLIADLRRYVNQSCTAGQSDVLCRLLAVVDHALHNGTGDVRNAVAEWFVEDTGWWDPAMQPFIEAWPPGLRAEVEIRRDRRQ